MNTLARLLLGVCAVVAADALAAEPPQTAAPSPAGPSTMSPSATAPDPSFGAKADGRTETSATTPHASADGPSAANKSKKKVLVDDTVNDAQLKQILARGYKPDSQARGNQVYYCRSEQEIGSRFEKKICKTAARILQDEVEGQNEASLLERPSGNRPKN